jgi:hypothetical protein
MYYYTMGGACCSLKNIIPLTKDMQLCHFPASSLNLLAADDFYNVLKLRPEIDSVIDSAFLNICIFAQDYLVLHLFW